MLQACGPEIAVKKPIGKPAQPGNTPHLDPGQPSLKPNQDESPPEQPSMKTEELWSEPKGSAAAPAPRSVEEIKQENFDIAIMRITKLADGKPGPGQWQVVGSVKDGQTTVKESGHDDVNKMNKAIIEYIGEIDAHFMPDMIGKTFTVDTLTSKLVSAMQYRRCTVYLFLQTSPVGSRLLAYGSTLIKHHAESFGTALSSVHANDIKEHLRQYKINLPADIRYFL